MQISNNNNQPSFKMAVKATQEAKEFLRKNLNGRQLHKLNKIVERQKTNPHDILLDTFRKKGKDGIEYIKATASNRTIVSEFGDMATIRKAERYVNKFDKLTFDEVFRKMADI